MCMADRTSMRGKNGLRPWECEAPSGAAGRGVGQLSEFPQSPEMRHFPGFIFAQNSEMAVRIWRDLNFFCWFIGAKIGVNRPFLPL